MPSRNGAESLVPPGFPATAEVSIWGQKVEVQVHTPGPRHGSSHRRQGPFETGALQGWSAPTVKKPVSRPLVGCGGAAICGTEPSAGRSALPSVVPSHARHLSIQPERQRFHGNRRTVEGRGVWVAGTVRRQGWRLRAYRDVLAACPGHPHPPHHASETNGSRRARIQSAAAHANPCTTPKDGLPRTSVALGNAAATASCR